MFNQLGHYPYFEEVNDGILTVIKKTLKQNPSKAGFSAFKPMFLDVGCGYGQLGEAITKLGFCVYGIEAQNEAVKKSKKRLEKVIPLDLTNFKKVQKALKKLPVKSLGFDAIVFSDVLEHIADPLGVLIFYKRFLKPGGRIYVSLPNMANWEQRFKILLGNFNYQDSGVLDRTHLRFFTFRTAKLLLTEAGYKIENVDYTPYIIRVFLPLIKKLLARPDHANQTGELMNSPLYKFYERIIYPLEYYLGAWWKSMFAFRIILEATVPAEAGIDRKEGV
jgi:2-polyprenyl-3-methyl-5-hydroxy-6-metoxy-1,4-benzoquinol methylase